MSEGALRRLLAVAGALVAIYLLIQGVSYLFKGGDNGGSGELTERIERAASDSLVGVRIVSARDTVVLEKTASGWTVNGHVAAMPAVQNLLIVVSNLAVVGVVSRSAENHARMGVVGDSALTITLRTTKDTVEIVVGLVAVRLDHIYARAPGESDVYEVRGELRTAAAVGLTAWRDKTVLRSDTAAVHTIVLERDGGRSTVQRSGSNWSGRFVDRAGRARDAQPEPRLLSAMLLALQHWEAATGFPRDTAFAGKETRRIVALGARGDTIAAVEIVGERYAWLARVRGDAQLYRVSVTRVDQLIPRHEELIGSGR